MPLGLAEVATALRAFQARGWPAEAVTIALLAAAALLAGCVPARAVIPDRTIASDRPAGASPSSAAATADRSPWRLPSPPERLYNPPELRLPTEKGMAGASAPTPGEHLLVLPGSRGAVGQETRLYYPSTPPGLLDPATGQIYPRIGQGFVNPKTGQYLRTPAGSLAAPR